MNLDTITCADALEFLRGLPDKSIDFIFTDPPYGHNNNDGDLIHNREKALGVDADGAATEARPILNDDPDTANQLFRDALPEFRRILKGGGCCCCCCCGGGGPDPMFARWSLWMDKIFQFKQMVIWDKGPMGMGWHYRRSYETVLVGQVPGAKCRWYDDSHKVENIIRPFTDRVKKIIPSKDQHPTEKPVTLPSFFIRLHTQPGHIVLDPFCGSGSTLIAARRLGRRYIGCDLSPEYVEMAQKRIEEDAALHGCELFEESTA